MLQIEGVSILSFYPDWMHCKSLGIDKPLLGSTLWVLVHHILPGSVEDNLSAVWRDIKAFYNELGFDKPIWAYETDDVPHEITAQAEGQSWRSQRPLPGHGVALGEVHES